MQEKNLKVSFGINFVNKDCNVLCQQGLVRIYRSFVISHLRYGEMVHVQHHNEDFCKKIDRIHSKATLDDRFLLKKHL